MYNLIFFQSINLTFVLQSVVDKLLKKANVSLVVGTSSWREQFVEAITVSPGRLLYVVHIFNHLSDVFLTALYLLCIFLFIIPFCLLMTVLKVGN